MARHTLAKAEELMEVALDKAWDTEAYRQFLDYIKEAPRTMLWILLTDAVRIARTKLRQYVPREK